MLKEWQIRVGALQILPILSVLKLTTSADQIELTRSTRVYSTRTQKYAHGLDLALG
jgi:hypothetical protein